MKVPGLSEAAIAAQAERGSVERGREYYDVGAVKTLKRRSDTEVEAFVQGTAIAPYRVEIRHDANGITAADCTCPYVTGSWCRHIVAALYAVMNSEGGLSRPVGDLLDEFNREELLHVLERIITAHPGAASTVEEAYRQKQSG